MITGLVLNDKTMIFKMMECRVQKTRRQNNLLNNPLGIVEFSRFAKTLDQRTKTTCIACPPDVVTDFYCAWEFTLEE